MACLPVIALCRALHVRLARAGASARAPLALPALRFAPTLVRAGDESVDVPRSKLKFAFARSSGAGGQNVNKVNTKAEIRFHIDSADWLDSHTKGRLRELFGGSVTKEGEIVVTSQRTRSQEANLEDAIAKLEEMVTEAAAIPAVRELKTDVGEHTKDRYKDDKKRRSDVKANRRKGGGWDD